MSDALDELLANQTPAQILASAIARKESTAKNTAVAQFPIAIPFFPNLSGITAGMSESDLNAAKSAVLATQGAALVTWLTAMIAFLDAAEPSADYATTAVDVRTLIQQIASGGATPTAAAQLLRGLGLLYRRVLASAPHLRSANT